MWVLERSQAPHLVGDQPREHSLEIHVQAPVHRPCNTSVARSCRHRRRSSQRLFSSLGGPPRRLCANLVFVKLLFGDFFSHAYHASLKLVAIVDKP